MRMFEYFWAGVFATITVLLFVFSTIPSDMTTRVVLMLFGLFGFVGSLGFAYEANPCAHPKPATEGRVET